MKDNLVTLLVQVFAIAIGGVTVGALLKSGLGAGANASAERQRGLIRRIAAWLEPHAGGLAITVAVIAAFTFWTQSWAFWVARSTERRNISHLSAWVAGYADNKSTANLPFLEFARGQIEPHGKYAIAPTTAATDEFTRQWTSYVLVPRLLSDPQDADAILILGANPRKVSYDRRRFPVLVKFQPRYAIALRRKSGER